MPCLDSCFYGTKPQYLTGLYFPPFKMWGSLFPQNSSFAFKFFASHLLRSRPHIYQVRLLPTSQKSWPHSFGVEKQTYEGQNKETTWSGGFQFLSERRQLSGEALIRDQLLILSCTKYRTINDHFCGCDIKENL